MSADSHLASHSQLLHLFDVIVVQAAAPAAHMQADPAAVALHQHSQGLAAAAGQGSGAQLAGGAIEAGLAAVEAYSQGCSGSSPKAVQQDGI